MLISLGSKKRTCNLSNSFCNFFCERFNCFYGQILKMMKEGSSTPFCWFFLCANFFVIFLSTPFDDQFDIIENWRIFPIYLSLFDLTNSYDEFYVKKEFIFFGFTCLNGIIFNYWWLLLFCLIWFDFFLFYLDDLHLNRFLIFLRNHSTKTLIYFHTIGFSLSSLC